MRIAKPFHNAIKWLPVMLVTAADMGILVVVSQDGRAMDAATVMGAIAGALGTT